MFQRLLQLKGLWLEHIISTFSVPCGLMLLETVPAILLHARRCQPRRVRIVSNISPGAMSADVVVSTIGQFTSGVSQENLRVTNWCLSRVPRPRKRGNNGYLKTPGAT